MRKVALFLLTIILALAIVPAYAHSGMTDGNGGHYNSSTGEYHYHHGYPAHSHTNGECPYEYDDKTGQSGWFTENYVQNTYSADVVEDPEEVKLYTTAGDIIWNIFFIVLFVFLAIFYLPFIIEGIRSEWEIISSKFRRGK